MDCDRKNRPLRVIRCSTCGEPAYRETDRERQPGHYTQLRCECRDRRLRILEGE